MIVETRALTKQYRGKLAVDSLDLVVPEASISAFLGPNGSGKTTTIKMLLDMVRPTSGEALVFGEPASAVSIRERVGYVAEDKRLYGNMTVARILEFTRPFYPEWSRDRERILLQRFDLPLDRKVRALSKGMHSKLALVLALSHRAQLLILDEPGEGLDPVANEQMLESIVEATGEGAAVFFSTHQVAEVERIADHVFILSAGRLAFEGSLEDLRANCRRVHAVFPGRAPLEDMRLPGVRTATADRNRLSIIADGNLETIERRARDLGAISVDLEPLSLREVFLAAVAEPLAAGQPAVDAKQYLRTSAPRESGDGEGSGAEQS